jgi:LuxR family maltose regulon positive regulatory protein
MPKEQTARVLDGYLGFLENGRFHPHIRVGTKSWYAWLTNHKGFTYQDESGSFTARCEQIKGKGAYWYAYRRHDKKVRKKYLGKTARLTPQRLRQIAAELAETPGTVVTTAPTSNTFSPLPKTTQAAVEASLLATKFTPPPKPPVHTANRSRLTEKLDAPIIYISAPAGYGKSILVSQWLRQAQVPYIWVTLDKNDDDQVRFWQVVLAAIKQVSPQVLPEAGLTTVRTENPNLTEVINSIQQIENPHCLILEDFHYIKNKAIQEDVALLLEHLPKQLQIMFTSRTEAPFNVGRWRAKGSYIDLNTNDLRFTPDEGVAFLTQMTDLSQIEMRPVVAKMEGWVTGLQLVSLALRLGGQVDKYLALPDKSIAYFQTYLLEDVLEREPAHVQTCLLQIAILRTLNIELCNAITGQDNSATMLAYLEEQNLFITAVPGRPGWYCMHQLFTDILADQLQIRLPDQVNALHLRAARWFQAAGFVEESVRHLLAAQAWEEAAVSIERIAPTIFVRGEVTRLLRWLEELPQHILQNHPLLVLIDARLRNDSSSEVIRRLGQNSADLGHTLSEEENTTDTQKSYHHILQAVDLMLRSLHHEVAQEWQDAGLALAQVMSLSATNGHTYITLQAAGMLAILHVWQGQLRKSEAIINQQTQQAQRPISQLTFTLIFGQCLIYYERNQLDKAHDLLMVLLDRIDARYLGEHHLRIRWLLLRVLSASGKHEAAEEIMAAIITDLGQNQTSWMVPADLAADQAYLWLRQDKLVLAEERIYKSGLQLDGGLTREDTYSQLVHAHILMAQKNHSAAEKLLNNLVAAFPAGIGRSPFFKLLLPLAIALFGQGKVNQAVRTLRQALQLVEGEGYVRPFLEHGADMAMLLALVGQQGQASQAIKQHIVLLLYEFGQSGIDIATITRSNMGALVTAASITAREQELLLLVAAGLSNREISQEQTISVNTVKSHLRRIYRKLEVHSRTEAVGRAQELRLLKRINGFPGKPASWSL